MVASGDVKAGLPLQAAVERDDGTRGAEAQNWSARSAVHWLAGEQQARSERLRSDGRARIAPDVQGTRQMTRKDQDALRRCVKIFTSDPRRAQQLNEHAERGDSLLKRQLFACYRVQKDSLKLELWETPPCHGDPHPIDERRFPEYQQRKLKARHLADRLRANAYRFLSPIRSRPFSGLPRPSSASCMWSRRRRARRKARPGSRNCWTKMTRARCMNAG